MSLRLIAFSHSLLTITNLYLYYQLGGLILKSYVREQWDAQCDHLNGRLITPDSDKEQIKSILPNGTLLRNTL